MSREGRRTMEKVLENTVRDTDIEEDYAFTAVSDEENIAL